jgi:hypothetical protein
MAAGAGSTAGLSMLQSCSKQPLAFASPERYIARFKLMPSGVMGFALDKLCQPRRFLWFDSLMGSWHRPDQWPQEHV